MFPKLRLSSCLTAFLPPPFRPLACTISTPCPISPRVGILGALFIGIGAGFVVRVGGATTGDDALAMSIRQLTGLGVETVYLVSDLTVLLLSLSYIPLGKNAYSLLTVILSGQITGWMQKTKVHR